MAETEGHEWNTYFHNATTPRMVYDIRAGKVSPWVVYLSDGGDQLFYRINDEQMRMISPIIDANFWFKIFKENTAEVDQIENLCKEANL